MSKFSTESSGKFEIVPLVGDEYELLNRCATNKFRKEFVKCGNTVFPGEIRQYVDRIRQLDVRNDDIWVVTFPKTGTTWVQEMTWLLANNMNFEAARSFIGFRFPFLEASGVFVKVAAETSEERLSDDFDSVSCVSEMPSPRLIKTHFPYELLPEKLQNSSTTKIIYVMRNPGDTCVSYYHHMRSNEGLDASLEEFCELFMLGQVPYGPYWNHMLGFWKRRHNPNVLVLKYEDMKKDLASTCQKVAKFIDKPLPNDQIGKLVEHLSFDNMKQNPAVNLVEQTRLLKEKLGTLDISTDHLRCGKVGQWEKILPDNIREKFQRWVEKNTSETGINFD